MTAAQILGVAQALDTAWTVTAVTAWLSCAAFLGAVVVGRWEEFSADLLAAGAGVLQMSRGAHKAGRHHRSGGRHRRGKLQGNPLDHPTEKVDDKPKPPKPAKGGAR